LTPTNDSQEVVITRRLEKIYRTDGSECRALRGVDLVIQRGEFTGLVGPSGSGKTTLLNIIGALDKPTAGEVLTLDHDIARLSATAAAHLRSRKLGFIFQTFNLLPVYTVFENVEFPLLLLGVKEPERSRRVMEVLEWVGLTDKRNYRPSQLSGGEAQRTAVARAMVKNPELILADEPTANLDSENSLNILETMQRWNVERGTTFLFATHDEKVIRFLKRRITLVDGQVSRDEQVA